MIDSISMRRTAGVTIEMPEIFFNWTILPYAQCFGIAAFAFHVEHAYRTSAVLRRKLSDPDDVGIRDHFGLEGDQVRISNFFGATLVEPAWQPFRRLAISDEGELYSELEAGSPMTSKIEQRMLFDRARPDARRQVKEVLERAIILRALEVRGRRESALARKEEIDVGCFYAGLEWDRARALFILDGAKLYDVELRVRDQLAPEDLSVIKDAQAQRVGAKRAGILEAFSTLWPNGIPAGMTVKERDKAICGFLQRNGVSPPSSKTIQRALASA